MLNPNVRFDIATTIAIPCGLNSRSTFDDTFKLFRCPEDNDKCTLTSENEIFINRTGIEFAADHFTSGNIDV